MSKASLRENWRLAEASSVHLSDKQIDEEIQRVRATRQRKAK